MCFIVNVNTFAQQGDKKTTSADTVKKVTPPALKDTLIETGVAVSPSTLRFNAKPGTLQTKTIKITNDTKKSFIFQLLFQDYGAAEDGESDRATSKYSMYSLSKYIVISPTVVEIGPRQAKTVTVTVDIPPGDSMAISMWTILEIDQVLDREKLELPNMNNKTVGMGVKNSFGFGVNIYQNPPNVLATNVEIMEMKFNKKNEKINNEIFLKVKNKGNGIGYCLYYLELTNMITGKQFNLKVKQFAIFPDYFKEFKYELPKDIEKGPYSAMAVLDFGNKDELQTAEMEFTID